MLATARPSCTWMWPVVGSPPCCRRHESTGATQTQGTSPLTLAKFATLLYFRHFYRTLTRTTSAIRRVKLLFFLSLIWSVNLITSPRLTSSQLISFNRNWVRCGWSQPWRTGSLHSERPILPWLRSITARSVKMNWRQVGWVQTRSGELIIDNNSWQFLVIFLYS